MIQLVLVLTHILYIFSIFLDTSSTVGVTDEFGHVGGAPCENGWIERFYGCLDFDCFVFIVVEKEKLRENAMG